MSGPLWTPRRENISAEVLLTDDSELDSELAVMAVQAPLSPQPQ